MARQRFEGRAREMRLLSMELEQVRNGSGAQAGRAIIIKGRRRVGKSRLVQQFADLAGVPTVTFQASNSRSAQAERDEFVAALAHSSLPMASLAAGQRPPDWHAALRLLASVLPVDSPAVAILDEVPWLAQSDPEFEGALQTVWDQNLSVRPVLLLLVGSDLSLMSAMQGYGRPFFGRAAPLTVEPLNPADVAALTGLDPITAFDAWLVTGGFPENVLAWPQGRSLEQYLDRQFDTSLSPLVAAGELTLQAEFPAPSMSRAVLSAIGSGDRSFSAIANAAGSDGAVPSGTLGPLLKKLAHKGVIAVDRPLATRAQATATRYRIADPYLQFWLRYIERGKGFIERGHPERLGQIVREQWEAWRGRAIEPIIRESLRRLLPSEPWPETAAVGGWWNRLNNPEVDLVGADREPVARQVHFVGSIKWRSSRPFDETDARQLLWAMPAVPGVTAETPMVAVSRTGFERGLPLASMWTPEELLAAWQ